MTNWIDLLKDDPIIGTWLPVPDGGLSPDHPLAGSYLDVVPDEPAPDEPPLNVTDDGVAHHAVLFPDGTERCQCGDDWPCDHAVALAADPIQRHQMALDHMNRMTDR